MRVLNLLRPDSSHLATVPTPLYRWPMVVALSVVLLAVFVLSQLAGTALFAPWVLPQGDTLSLDERVLLGGENGTVVSLAAFFTLAVLIALITLFIKVKHGRLSEYLGLRRFRWGQLLGFGVALLLLNVVINVVTIWLEREPMQFMDQLAVSAHPLWLLVVAIVVVVPIYEELIFRGFMWSGLSGTRLGVWGAAIITSFIFALSHLQYDLLEMGMIIALALLFSHARAVSGSLLLPIALHMLNNGLAMWQYLGY